MTKAFPVQDRTMAEVDVATAALLSKQIGGILAGRPAAAQGEALATCLAIWLASHHAHNPLDTQTLRAELLDKHVKSVRRLMGIAP